ncbi:monooxygenase FAD-binding protein [Trametes maxima]|nr:monooxygenase FAD-binding protein [Trametes maxima]
MASTNSSSPATNQVRIVIVGGGPGGLVLLLTLLRRGIHATLYEREASRDTRAHLGGILDLEWDSGQRALRENGLEEAFRAHSLRDAEENRICGKDGVLLLHDAGADPTDDNLKDSRPEIDRHVLRGLLLDALPSDAIKWGHSLSSVRTLGNGEHELTFTNGLVVFADMVVGADGAHSRVRPLVSPFKPAYQGVTGAELSLPPPVVALPENEDIRKGVGRGSCFAAEDVKLLAFQRNGDGRIRTYAFHRAPLEWTLPSDPKEAKKVLLELYHDWAPWMRRLIEQADENAIYPRPLFHLPTGHRWTHTPGITLIGDAAHLMSPFAGAGANLAMRDGIDLGLVLAGTVGKALGSHEREAAVAAWEAETFERVGKFAAVTEASIEAFLNVDAPHSAVAAFKSARGEVFA